MNQDIADLARQLTPPTQRILRQGIITAASGQSCSVKWGNAATASPNQVCLGSYTPKVADVVWGIRDGDDCLVLGPVTTGAGRVKLAEVVLGTAASSLAISNIPAGYSSLEVHHQGWLVTANAVGNLRMRFNGDTANNYSGNDIYCTSTVGGAWYGATGQAVVGEGSTGQTYPHLGRIEIANYAATDRYKTFLIRNGGLYGGDGWVQNVGSGVWANAAVLTSISIFSGNGYNLGAGSSMTVFGVN